MDYLDRARSPDRVDARSNQVVASIPIGPQPRFLTVGAGSVWTLNKEMNDFSRRHENQSTAGNHSCSIPGTGGEIAFGRDPSGDSL